METTMDLAIRKSVTVNATVERAFDVFTRDIAAWWPLETHSIRAMREGTPPRELHLEPCDGGRLFERTDGDEHEWGRVVAYEPPHRIAIEWHVNPANPPTDIEVTFTEEGGGTRVDLVHGGWERYEDPERATRAEYGSESGWTTVLARYAEAASN